MSIPGIDFYQGAALHQKRLAQPKRVQRNRLRENEKSPENDCALNKVKI